MARLYTRGGDSGFTVAFFKGSPLGRVPKSHPLVEALGSLDEANSFIGLARALLPEGEGEVGEVLRWLQKLLFDVGFSITSSEVRVGEGDVARMEELIDRFYGEPLRRFILPSGPPAAAALHVARSVLRRAERRLVGLRDHGLEVDSIVLKAVNRAGDLLFALAIYLARRHGGLEEV